MRNWLSWVVGFALAFGGLLAAMLVYSFDQPSLWLPVLFGIAFFGILGFALRPGATSRVGIALLFGAGSCLLWMSSNAGDLEGQRGKLHVAFQAMLLLVGLFGLILFAVGYTNPKKPSLAPILFLMLLGWLISYFSSSSGGASPMIDWVIHTFHWSRAHAELVVVVIRKTIHVTFYALVGFTAYLAALRNGANHRTSLAAGFTAALFYASFDEARQSTQVGRGGSVWDVLLDVVGASVALTLVNFAEKRHKAQRR